MTRSNGESDEQFLERAAAVLGTYIDDKSLDAEDLAEKLGMSRSHLYRKVQELKGQTVSEFIRDYRLEAAATLLAGKEKSVTEVALAVGFDNLSYFCRCFQRKYGVKPSKYES